MFAAMFKSKSKFTPKRSLEQWLADYAVSHQHPFNKALHWFCVPTIFASLIGMGMSWQAGLTLILLALALLFYVQLSPTLAFTMAVFIGACVAAVVALPFKFKPYFTVFVVAWVGQFIGHKIEGQKPSFFEDLQFLLIGPAWLMQKIVRFA